MPIDNWLDSLPQQGHACVDGDLEALAAPARPFMNAQSTSNQIEKLSGHLGGLKEPVRRLVIGYSLYIRQLDTMLESGPRSLCASGCPRPPAGCCNRDHFITLSTLDIMSAQRSPLALHMAHVIGTLQQSECTHSLAQGRVRKPGYCSCLAEDGCTMRLFKSPRCAHYLCEGVEQAVQAQHQGRATDFLAAMHSTVRSRIFPPGDFTNPEVIATGAALFWPQQA